jgi:class 3 adenylate cyclase
VNVAARLQELTKERGTPVLVSQSTRVRVSDAIPLVEAGTVEVRGRVQRLAIFVPRDVDPAGEQVRSA